MTSSDSMIERVTKTLSGELLRRGFMTQIEDGVRLKPDIEAMARAAIEAMMEPTPEVCGAMMDVLMFQGDIYQNENGQIVVESITPKDLLRAALRTSLTGDTK